MCFITVDILHLFSDRDVSASPEADNKYRETATERFEMYPTYFSHLIKCADKVPIVLTGRGVFSNRPLPYRAKHRRVQLLPRPEGAKTLVLVIPCQYHIHHSLHRHPKLLYT